MNWLVPLLLGLVVTWAAACGDGEDNPISKTPSPDPPADFNKAGNVVFSPGGVDSAAQWGADDYELGAVAVAGDTLTVTVSYSGGCRTHRFTLVAAEGFLESDPVQLDATIAHDADGDPCEAYPTGRLPFHTQSDQGAVQSVLRGRTGHRRSQARSRPGRPIGLCVRLTEPG